MWLTGVQFRGSLMGGLASTDRARPSLQQEHNVDSLNTFFLALVAVFPLFSISCQSCRPQSKVLLVDSDTTSILTAIAAWTNEISPEDIGLGFSRDSKDHV